MNVLSYNIIGGGNVVKRKRVSHLIQSCKVGICFIRETKLVSLNPNLYASLWRSLEVEWSESRVVGAAGGVTILWDFLNLYFSFRGEGYVGGNTVWRGQDIFFVNVYSPCCYDLKKRLWRDLLVLKGKFSMGIR